MFKKIILSFLLGLVLTGKILAQSVDYYLPYPGILPDHPLYWLKMVRDRIVLVAAAKPETKAEKMLLYADKRLGAAWALIDGNKIALGVSTLTKAEKYLEQAVELRDVFPDKDRLDKAVIKHLEVLAILKEKSGSYADQLEEMTVKLKGLSAAETDQKTADAVTELTAEAAETGTALGVLEKIAAEKGWEVITKDYSFGKMVEAIAGTANNQDNAWIFYVNGEAGDKAGDQFKVKPGDKVEWRYEAVKP